MPLSPFASVDRSALRWLRTQAKPLEFTLSSGDLEVARLSWTSRGGSLASATRAEGSWTLKRAGFLVPQVTVREPGSDAPLAHLAAHRLHHEIRIRGAPTYLLHHVSHILPAWRVSSAQGTEVLHIEPVAERGVLMGGAVILSSCADAPEALLLVVLSWYFIVLASIEDELIDALVPFEGPDAPRKFGDGR